MRKIFTILMAVLFTAGVFAQSPDKMSYQAIVRDLNNSLVINQEVGMQISILQGSISGFAVYEEIFNLTTNGNGLVTVEIGGGTPVSGDFSNVDWANGPYFIKTETDPTGGTDYTITGVSQLLSVPYALHAKEVENVDYSQISNVPDLFDGDYNSLINTPDLSGYITNETDPVFSAWDKNYNDLINQPVLFDGDYNSLTSAPDLSGYITTETDPAFSAWDKDYNDLINQPALFDGDYNSLSNTPDFSGYITIETDPVFSAWDKNYNDLVNQPTLFSGSFTDLTNKPTTVAGYGITDAFNGTWNSLIGKPTFAIVATSGSYNDLSDKPAIPGSADGSETKLTAGTNITLTGSGTAASPYIINATGATPLTIGQSYQGGIIFWVDESGQHGLIAATVDQSAGVQWRNGSNITTDATVTAVYAGKTNTNKIISIQGEGSYAAQICADYSITVNNEYYDDWYLPSKFELYLLYTQRNLVGGLTSAFYWSSTEYDFYDTYSMRFTDGAQGTSGKYYAYGVRAIRAF